MSRRPLLMFLAVPLMIAGSLAAHVITYRIVLPDAVQRAHVLAVTGHGYLESVPLLIGVLTSLAVVGFVLQLAEGLRGHARARVSATAFFLLPPVAFAVQEYLERLVHTGHFPAGAALQPTFFIGLALQLPFGFVAFLLAHLLCSLANSLSRVLRSDPLVRRPRSPLSILEPTSALPLRRPALALGHAERGPPFVG